MCNLCKGSEYILDNLGCLHPCLCLLNRRREEYSKKIIPSRYQGSRISNLQQSDKSNIDFNRQQKVIGILKLDPLSGYLFFGPTGVGKSHLMYTLANEAIFRGRHVICSTCSDIIKSARESEFGGMESVIDKKYLDYYLEYEVSSVYPGLHIFIDEWDKVKLTEYNQLLLFDIVNLAYDYPSKIKLSITSNLPPVKFSEVFGPALFRKLKEVSRPIIYGG